MRFSRLFFPAVVAFLTLAVVPANAQTYTESVLYSFCNQANCADGSNPAGTLVQGANGELYGTATAGGTGGTAFSLNASGTLTVLHSFCTVENIETNCADGSSPRGLVLAKNGNFYGATTLQGSGAYPADNEESGTAFQLTPSGTLTTLYSFCSQPNCADGGAVSGSLIQGSDSDLYGTTLYGGNEAESSLGAGTVFKITTAGTLTPLYSFCPDSGCIDGQYPNAPLVEGKDGNYYGTTLYGGGHGSGSVFMITPAGSLSTVYSFCNVGDCLDGIEPAGGLLLGKDGNFYGLTFNGGANYGGTFYKLTPSGSLTTLYSFCSATNCADGRYPTGNLIQDSDGDFYGVTEQGGATIGSTSNAAGTAFKITAAGTLTTLHTFCANAVNCADGQSPQAGLVHATNGYFYGITNTGGANNEGTVYVIAAASTRANASLSFSASPYPASVGQTVTLSATASGSAGDPTGNVTFSANGLALCTGTLSNGKTSCSVSTSSFASGTYAVTVTYSGDPTYNAATASASATLNPAPTSVTLSAENSPITPPQSDYLSVSVARTGAGAAGEPAGKVAFYSGPTLLGSVALSNGQGGLTAMLPQTLAPATYPVTAKYAGDSGDSGSVSNTIDVAVTTATQTTLTISPNPVPANSNFTITAQVNEEYLSGVPTGSVQIHFGPYDFGNYMLNSSGAVQLQLSSSDYSAKTYAARGYYSGDAKNAVSDSLTVDVVVQ